MITPAQRAEIRRLYYSSNASRVPAAPACIDPVPSTPTCPSSATLWPSTPPCAPPASTRWSDSAAIPARSSRFGASSGACHAKEGVDQALAAGHGVSLPHPADRLRSDSEQHLAAVRVELGPEPEGLPVGFPARARMALTNAERPRRFRERRAAGVPIRGPR